MHLRQRTKRVFGASPTYLVSVHHHTAGTWLHQQELYTANRNGVPGLFDKRLLSLEHNVWPKAIHQNRPFERLIEGLERSRSGHQHRVVVGKHRLGPRTLGIAFVDQAFFLWCQSYHSTLDTKHFRQKERRFNRDFLHEKRTTPYLSLKRHTQVLMHRMRSSVVMVQRQYAFTVKSRAAGHRRNCALGQKLPLRVDEHDSAIK